MGFQDRGGTGEPSDILRRKRDHLRVVTEGLGRARGVTAGFEAYRFEHCALPELDLAAIDLSCQFLGRRLRAPVIVSCMTGGPKEAGAINRHIAEAAAALGIGFGVGSQRVALRHGGEDGLRGLRDLAPDVPILANLGGAQLVAEFGPDEAMRAVDMVGADALVIHFNPLQEAVQPRGDRNWKGVLAGFERIARSLPVPVIAKEVGFGLSAAVARRLVDAGAAAIDVAGAGGTNWAAVEAARIENPRDRGVAETFAGWGIPTAEAIMAVRAALPGTTIIGSGGIGDGIDAATAIRLGADLVGQAAAALGPARQSTAALVDHLSALVEELRIVCFATASSDLAALRKATLAGPVKP